MSPYIHVFYVTGFAGVEKWNGKERKGGQIIISVKMELDLNRIVTNDDGDGNEHGKDDIP